MLRDILTNKGVLACLLFFILMVGGSLFYRWYVNRGIQDADAKHQQFLQQLETKRGTRTAQDVGVPTETKGYGQAEPMSVETNDTPEGVTGTDTPPMESEAHTDSVDGFKSTATGDEDSADVPVSPYGFGPYPELPEEWAEVFPPKSIKHELMVRVAVKLREQGVNVEGTSMKDGLVYPVIKGIRYVRWAETDEGVKYIARSSGHPDDGTRLQAIRIEKNEPLTEADIPLDIKVLSYEEAGIDPYTFLDLGDKP